MINKNFSWESIVLKCGDVEMPINVATFDNSDSRSYSGFTDKKSNFDDYRDEFEKSEKRVNYLDIINIKKIPKTVGTRIDFEMIEDYKKPKVKKPFDTNNI